MNSEDKPKADDIISGQKRRSGEKNSLNPVQGRGFTVDDLPGEVPVVMLRGPLRTWSSALTGLFILALLYSAYFGRDFFVPVVMSMVVALILAPVVRAFSKIGIPRPVSAFVVMAMVIATAGFSLNFVAKPALDMLQDAPRTLRKVTRKLDQARGSLEDVTQITEKVSAMAGPKRSMRVETTSLQQDLLSNAAQFGASLLIMLMLTYFMLASGDDMLRRLLPVLGKMSKKKQLVYTAKTVGREVSRYMATVTLINLALGVAIALVFSAFDLPEPVLFGVLAAVLNFVPYLGAITGAAIVGIVSVVTFPTLTDAIWMPALYLGISGFEGYLVTPSILGRRMPVAPMPLVLGLLFWGWIWGAAGAFVSVPIMVSIKILCDQNPHFSWLGALLGRASGRKRRGPRPPAILRRLTGTYRPVDGEPIVPKPLP